MDERDGRIWAPLLRRRLTAALAELQDALRACPDELWDASVWPVRKDHPFVWPVQQVDGTGADDPEVQERLLARFSAFWNVAYHAIFFVDLDLSTRDGAFSMPEPFVEADHEGHRVPNRPYTRDELLGYVDHVARKAQALGRELTDADAVVTIADHRHGPRSYAEVVLGAVIHAHEHAAQLHLFLGQHEHTS